MVKLLAAICPGEVQAEVEAVCPGRGGGRGPGERSMVEVQAEGELVGQLLLSVLSFLSLWLGWLHICKWWSLLTKPLATWNFCVCIRTDSDVSRVG